MTAREELLDALRPTAFAVAYRMLGSVAEAEDVVQEALLRVHGALDGDEPIASPRAYVATVATRLAVNELRSARVRRERYVGTWLPEPILTGDDARGGPDDPARRAETADSLSMALLVLLETLSPEQRAALLLHDVFGYGHAEIATILGRSEAAVRQLAARARRRVGERRPRAAATRAQHDALARRFVAAAHRGDLAGLEALLADDVALTGDGGGRVPTLARTLRGRRRVARTLGAWLRLGVARPGMALRATEVNDDPGVLVLDGAGRLVAVWALEVADARVTRIRSIVNPDKLAHLGPVTDLGTLLRSTRSATITGVTTPTPAARRPCARRLWALDGPRLTMDRADLLDGAEPGPVRLVVPSFLVEHDDGLLLLDAGIDPRAADDADGPEAVFGELGRDLEYAPEQRLDRQLAAFGFATTDVTHVVLSHAHFDHTGGLRLFPHATFLVGAGDRPSVRGEEHEIAREADLAPTRDFAWTFLDGDHDVFGDGAVVVLAMPGHTPGNTSLLVRLPQRTILLAADTAHLRSALTSGRPMSADTDREEAAVSLARLTRVAAEHDAQVWVGHDPDDWERFGGPGPVDDTPPRG